MLRSLIQEAYKVRDSIFLVVDFRGRVLYWSDILSKVRSRYSLTEEKLMELVEYLIDNVFVSVGNRVYKQCVGIPMGTDCAPLFANLYFEYRYMKSLIIASHSVYRRYIGMAVSCQNGSHAQARAAVARPGNKRLLVICACASAGLR